MLQEQKEYIESQQKIIEQFKKESISNANEKAHETSVEIFDELGKLQSENHNL